MFFESQSPLNRKLMHAPKGIHILPLRIKTDLKAVRAQIDAGAFRSIYEFQHALCTMFLNVQMMHPVGTEVRKSRYEPAF